MGVSASSLLDDSKSNYIKGRAEAELKEFSPYYRKQFSVVQFCQVEDDLEPNKQKITQLLKQKAPEAGEVLYEEGVLYFDDTRKWRERYVVVRANYCLECHDSLETFVKGVPPRHKLLPTGGTVLTEEGSYLAMVDKCFPDDSSVKEDFAPPPSGMPGQFPVYLRLPYRRDSYFCFRLQAKQTAFLSILSDCIRHQNHDFLKKKTCEVQAFLKAVQLYRQDNGRYEAWDMLIGSDVRVMANVVMEQLLPSLERDMLPHLKAKRTERKRVWFATVEAAYVLVQEHLLEGLSALKDECRASGRQQEVLIHSDMDQILQTRRQLEEKIRAKVSEPAEKLCSESVHPYLGSILEELMEPVTSGFLEGRQLSESMMDQVCQDVLQGANNEPLKKALANMSQLNLQSCYEQIDSLNDKLQHLQDRFGFCNISGLIHSAQIDLQQLIENASCTFQQLLFKAVTDNPDSSGSAVEKVKHRVLKQYDYDSSTVRKRIFQDALVSITLPFIKKNLVPSCKAVLQVLQPSVDSDHSDFIHVENVYESVLLQTLDKEVTKVVKEAASQKKNNLFTDSRDLLSQSSRSSLSSPSPSTPGSPSMTLASPTKTSAEPQPPSPLVLNGLSSVPLGETPLGTVQLKEAAAGQEAEPRKEEDVQTVKAEATPPSETVVQQDVMSVPTEGPEAAAETASSDPKQTGGPDPPSGPETGSQPADTTEEETPHELGSEAPSAGGAPETVSLPEPPPVSEPVSDPPPVSEPVSEPPPVSEPVSDPVPVLESVPVPEPVLVSEPAPVLEPVPVPELVSVSEPVPVSDPNSLNVSGGSGSAPLDLESTDEGSMTSDVLEDAAQVRKSPLSSDDGAEDKTGSAEPTPPTRTEAASADDGGVIEAGASVEAEPSAAAATTSPPTEEDTPPGPEEAPPLDCIKEIRDLVVEVFEVEELVQHYPDGVPTEE
ncbi:protein Niban 1a isoform X2 [Brachyistius frenatus]|uniref:protein Niban 1a isoform X2 n=1 Tax=Brachyistius frenatus TaxID=100188 RepID=UPI0037E8BE21